MITGRRVRLVIVNVWVSIFGRVNCIVGDVSDIYIGYSRYYYSNI